MQPHDAQTRVSYVLALLNGTPRHVAFEVALGRWRAQNAGAEEAVARRAVVRILASVWAIREAIAPVPRNDGLRADDGVSRLP